MPLVAVPYRDAGCRWRRRAWEQVSHHLAALPWPVVTVDDGGDLFARGASLNTAFLENPDVDVVVACDADLLVPLDNLRTAVDMAATRPGLVQPFDQVEYLNADGSRHTVAVSSTTPLLGGCNVLSRNTWLAAGGWLPGFRGWCAEDIAMATQCDVFAGPLRRLDGLATHLYHPKTGEYVDDATINRNGALMRQVNELAGDPAALRAFVEAQTCR